MNPRAPATRQNGTVTTPTDAERIARRYPRSKVPRRAWILVAVVLGIVGGAWVIWSAVYGANPAVSARVASFTVVSDQQIDATVAIQRPDPSVPVTCTLKAQALNSQVAGELPVELGPTANKLENIDVSIRTFIRAVTVVVDSCTVD